MAELVVAAPRSPRAFNEAQLVQNVALGAVLIWRFVAHYDQASHRGCALPLCFTVLPILFHHATRDAAITTNPGSPLAKFVEKLDQRREDLLAIHERMQAIKALSLRSIQLAMERGLVSLLPEEGTVIAFQTTRLPPVSRPEALRPMIRAAEKLGGWFAPHDLAHISNQLRVFF
jgi:hypothetical protein